MIEDANDTNAGLSSYIFSENLTEVMTATERLKFGEYANCEAEEVVNGYHAGWRESGLGGADGIHGFEEYYNTTVSYIDTNVIIIITNGMGLTFYLER